MSTVLLQRTRTLPAQTFVVSGGSLEFVSGFYQAKSASLFGFTKGTTGHFNIWFGGGGPGIGTFVDWIPTHAYDTIEFVAPSVVVEAFATVANSSAYAPSYADSVLDGMGDTGLTIGERIQPGQTLVATVRLKLSGSTVETQTLSKTITSAADWVLDYETQHTLTVINEAGFPSTTKSFSASMSWPGGLPSTGCPTVSGSSPANHLGPVVDGSASPAALSLTVPAKSSGGGWSTESNRGSVGYTWRPQRSANVSGVLRAMESAYPSSLTMVRAADSSTFSASAAWSDNQTQERYSGSISLTRTDRNGGSVEGGATNTTSAVNTYAAIGYYLDPASLSAAGLDSRLRRVQIRCWAWSALTLAHAASVTVDDGSSLTPTGAWAGAWSGVSGASVAVVSGAIQVTGGGVAQRTFSVDQNLTTYRYLRVRVKASAASAPVNLTIGTKLWLATTHATPGTYTDIDFDLSIEDNHPDDSDADTLWPVNQSDGISGVQDLFGVQRCGTLRIGGLTAGVTYDIDSVQLVRQETAARLDVLPAWNRARFSNTGALDEPWPVKEYPDETDLDTGRVTTHACRRCLLALSDGQQALELPDQRYTAAAGGGAISTFVPEWISIADTVSQVNRVNGAAALWPGWSATDARPAPVGWPADWNTLDWLLNSERPTTELCGGGALADSAGWHYHFGTDAVEIGATPVSIPAQLLVDRIESWIPDCGDLFSITSVGGGGGDIGGVIDPEDPPAPTSGALEIRPAWIGLGGAHGLAVEDGTPLSGQQMDVFDHGTTGEDPAGDGTSDSRGYWRSGDPWGKRIRLSGSVPISDFRVRPHGEATPEVGIGVWPSRKVNRASLRGPETARAGIRPCSDISPTMRIARAYLDSGDSSVHIGFATYGFSASGWSDLDTGIVADSMCIRFAWVRGDLALVLVTDEGGTIKRRVTLDEGGTFSVATTIGTGTRPGLAISDTGVEHHLWRKSDGRMVTRVLDQQGNEMIAETTVLAAGSVADDSITAVWRMGWVVAQYVNGSGSLITIRSQDGVTYS